MKDESKGQSVAVREEQALIPDMTQLAPLGEALAKSQMWPQFKTPAAVVAVVEYGRELGIPPAAALNTMAVVNGRLTMEAKAMLAVANRRAGVTWQVLESTAKNCKMKFSRPGFEPIEVEFDEKDAQAAGLIGKQNWRMYPKDMYFARAASRGVRQIAADAVLGLYSKEEMADTIEAPVLNVVQAPSVEPPRLAPATTIAPQASKPAQEKKTEEKPAILEVAEVVRPDDDEPYENPDAPPEPEEGEEQGDLGDEPEPIRVATDEQKKLIEDGISTMVLNGRNRDELLKKMNAKIAQVFGAPKPLQIPDELTYDMAVMLMALIQNTLKKLNGGAKK